MTTPLELTDIEKEWRRTHSTEHRQKVLKSYAAKLGKVDQKQALQLQQVIHDLGCDVEEILPDTKNAGLLYARIMRLDALMDEVRAEIQATVQWTTDLDVNDLVPFDDRFGWDDEEDGSA